MTPKQTVTQFFEAWQMKQWQMCLAYIQLSWKHEIENPDRSRWQKFMEFLQGLDYSRRPLNMLRKKLDSWDVDRIDGIEMVEAPNMNPAIVKDATVKIKTQKGRLIKLRLRLIKELGPYRPSADGNWGINPASIHEI